MSGFKAALLHDTILPLVLKARSEGELVAGLHRKRFARRLTLGYVAELIFHHARGLVCCLHQEPAGSGLVQPQ